MKLGARLTAGAALLGIAGIVAAVYGCGSRFAVGDIRERSQEAERERAVRSLELEAVTTFKTTDSPSPVWSPDGETLVYAERYNARLYAYSPVDESREVIFDGNQNTALPDLRYNVDAPAFLDSHHVLSGPAWASGLDQNDAWSGVLQIDIVNKTASAFGNFGARPRVSPDGSRVLLEASDGIRMTSPDGTEIDRFKNLRDGHWAPDGQSFVALSYDRYYDDVDGLVHINLEGRTEKIYGGPAYEPAWHPDGGGIAFTRPSRGDMYFHPEWMYGTVIFLDLEQGDIRPVADTARTPVFLSDSHLLLYDTMGGVGITDFDESRVLRDVRLSQLTPSPDGKYLAGVSYSRANHHYQAVDVHIYAISYD